MVALAKTLDVTGMRCPLPVLKAGKLLRTMAAGEELTVLATDPMAELDFRHFCNESGHELLEISRSDEILTIRLRARRAA
ncbi:MAG: sulfurtransferase TusA family protein [Alphaproteobacteria bacterium]|nr:MAG: sulfurtransferase TusA family protein [Alphaproteobacteria bacterium]